MKMDKEYEGKTHMEVMRAIGEKNTVSEFEEKFVLYWARRLTFDKAVVVAGIIYPNGVGEAFSCNAFAKGIFQILDKAEGVVFDMLDKVEGDGK